MSNWTSDDFKPKKSTQHPQINWEQKLKDNPDFNYTTKVNSINTPLPKWAKAFNSSDFAQTKLKNLNNVDSNGQRSDYATIRSTPINNLNTPLTSTTTVKPQNKSAWSNWVSQYTNRLNETGDSNKPKVLKDIGTGLGFLLDYVPNNVSVLKPFQRAANSGAEVVVGKGQLLDYNGNKIANPNQNLHTNKVVDFIADQAGNLAGISAIPMGGKNLYNAGSEVNNLLANKLTSKIGNTELRRYATTAAENALNAGLGSAADTARFGGNAKDVAKSGLQGALTGAVFSTALKGVGDLKKSAFPKWATTYESGTSDLKPLGEDLKVNTKGNSLNPLKNSIKRNAETSGVVSELIPNNLDSPLSRADINNTKIPKLDLTPPLKKISKFKTNTLNNSPFLQSDDVQKIINDTKMQYDVKPNVQSVERATKELESNFDGVVERINKVESLNSAEDTTAAGLITKNYLAKARETGDYLQLQDWLKTVQPKVTTTAQSLQAVNTWKDLSPEGVLHKAQQVVDQVNRDGEKVYGKNFKKVSLSTDEISGIDKAMNKISKMPGNTPDEIKLKDREFAKVKAQIANKIPSTLADKVKGLQRISLLLNTKTNVRNVAGNVILTGLENVKDIPGSLIDKAVSLKTGERTTLMPSLIGVKTQGKGFKEGFKNVLGDIKAGVDTAPTRGQFDLPENRVFKNNILNALDKTTSTALRFGDEPFYQAAYNEGLRQQMKINGVTEPTKEMIVKAEELAKDRTLQNVSSMVTGFQKIREGLNGGKDIGLGNFVLPFAKTPANILDKAVSYSPIGTIQGITLLMSKKAFNQKMFVDRIGRSLTGSAIIMLGYDLAKSGILTGKANSDKEVAALEKQTGKSPYSIKTGDTYRTIDWAQPAAIPLAIGADIYTEGKDRKAAQNVIWNAIKSGGNTLFSQSLLQGVQRLFGGYNAMESFGNTAANIPTQFVPTLGKQIAQLTDKAQRDTSSSTITGGILNQMKAKVPGLSSTLPQKLDTLGRPLEQYQGKNNLYNVFINPGYTTKDKANTAEKLALDVYNKTGSKTQFPRIAGDTIKYRSGKDTYETITLTPKEKLQFQEYIGQETNKAYNNLTLDQSFMIKEPKDKVKYMQNLLANIYTEGEKKILNGRGLTPVK